MIIYDPKITGSFEVNGSSLSSLESIDSVSGSVVDLTAATSSYALENSISGSFTSTSSSLASELLKNTTDTLTGDLTVTGTLTAQDLHVQEVTSSIVFSSGSNKFGENVSDTQKFTGSLQVSGSIDLEDNAKINIGTGNDLQVYHDGSNSYIKEAGTGVLSIQSDGTEIQINNGASEYMGRFITDAGVKLYYDNSLKFETTTTGVDVTGDITIDAGKKLAYSSTAFMTPENNVTGAEISTPGDFRIKTGNPPTLALTLGGSQEATFAGIVQIGASSATNLSLGSNSTDFELSAKKDGTDAISMVFKTQASGGALGEAMRITSGGDIGINYSGPFNQISSTETTLAISNSNIAALYLNNTHVNGHRWILTSGTDGAFGFYDKTEAASRMVIDSSGNVGISTESPSAKLEIRNDVAASTDLDPTSIKLYNNSDGGSAIEFSNGVSGNSKISFGVESTGAGTDDTFLGFSTGQNTGLSERMRIDSSGNVGIGTDSPAQKLDVVGKMKISDDIILAQTNGRLDYDNGNSSGALRFHSTSGNTERMRITSAGNVGIGTTDPSVKLHVNGGDLRVRDSGNVSIQIVSSDSGQSAIQFGDDGDTNDGRIVYMNATDLMRFFTNDGEKMVIDSSGNVGIGTDSPTGKLSVVTNGNHLHLRANTATAGKYWNFDITSDNQLYIVNNGGTGIQVLDDGKVGIGGTPEQKLHVEGRGVFDGGTSSDILQIRNDNGGGVFGMTANLFALDLASTSNFRIRQGSTVPLYLKSDGNLGIGTTNPFAPLQVNGTHSTLNAHFGQGTNNSNGVFGGISLGYSESNALYRKVGIVAQAKGDNSARQDLHFLVDIANDQNSAGIADSKMMIAHDTGYVGIATAAPAAPLHVHGNIQSKEGIISPTFYVARNYGSTSGNFAGYDDITEGDIIDIRDHSIGSLQAFAHGQLDPVINGSSDSIDWNYFRLLFRYTNNSATYTNYTVGFKLARYFYSDGWTENSAEFAGNGMDGARGPRWAVSPWTTTGGTDVPGIGLKYYDNYTHTQTIRVHAIYIQYKS